MFEEKSIEIGFTQMVETFFMAFVAHYMWCRLTKYDDHR